MAKFLSSHYTKKKKRKEVDKVKLWQIFDDAIKDDESNNLEEVSVDGKNIIEK